MFFNKQKKRCIFAKCANRLIGIKSLFSDLIDSEIIKIF